MSNPFRKKIPWSLDLKIRYRVAVKSLTKRWQSLLPFGALLVVPAMAAFLFFINAEQPTEPDTAELVAAIREAQASELAKSTEGIYHTKRMVVEGSDKDTFVAVSLTEVEQPLPPRVDVVETWQHNDTALALIESDSTERPFEVFLSREHNGILGLHHYGPKERALSITRQQYDDVHDIATLYGSYRSLERPAVPILPEQASFARIDELQQVALFEDRTKEGLVVTYVVDLSTKLVEEEIIYVVTEDAQFEMSRIVYLERSVVPADQFETIFDPTRFAYEQIS